MSRFQRELLPGIAPAADYLYRVAQLNALTPRVTSVFRSTAQQRWLRQRWERGLSPIYAAPAGQSLHQFHRAFDMVTDNPAAIGALWQRMGGRWYPSDPVHFEA